MEIYPKGVCFKMIVIFGGAFNPPTIAHYEVAKHILRLPEVSSLLFVPVGDQYEKAGLIPAFHRVKMLEIMIRGLPNASISKVEVESERELKSVETLERLQKIYPDSELTFLMGADNLYGLVDWHDCERLVKEFKMMILNRGAFDVHAFIKDNFELEMDHFIIIDDFSKINVSSSEYRADLTRTEILLPDVETYIRENGLYRD